MYAIMLIVLRVNNFMSRLRVTRVVFDSSNLSFFFFVEKTFALYCLCSLLILTCIALDLYIYIPATEI